MTDNKNSTCIALYKVNRETGNVERLIEETELPIPKEPYYRLDEEVIKAWPEKVQSSFNSPNDRETNSCILYISGCVTKYDGSAYVEAIVEHITKLNYSDLSLLVDVSKANVNKDGVFALLPAVEGSRSGKLGSFGLIDISEYLFDLIKNILLISQLFPRYESESGLSPDVPYRLREVSWGKL